MKKLLSVFISILIICSAAVALPAFAAEEGYKKGDIVNLSFTCEEITRAFTGIEGKITFGKALSVTNDNVTFPHIAGTMFNANETSIAFNATDTDNNYDITSDKVIVNVAFTVNEALDTLPVEAQIDDVYYRDGKELKTVEGITLPCKLKFNVYEPSSQETTAPATDATASTTATDGTSSTDVTSPTEATEQTSSGGDTTPTNTAATSEATSSTDATVPATESTEPSETTPEEDTKTTITLKKTSAKVYVKKSMTIGYTVENGSEKTTFQSSAPKVAKVNAKGKVTALKKGSAKIAIENNGVKKVFTVKVINPKLNKTKLKLKVGQKFKLKITGKAGKAVFKSSNKKIVVVNSSGKLKAKTKGSAYIVVKTNGNVKLKCKIAVK